jgi:hypothetical protein
MYDLEQERELMKVPACEHRKLRWDEKLKQFYCVLCGETIWTEEKAGGAHERRTS